MTYPPPDDLIKELLKIYDNAEQITAFHLYPLATGAFIGAVGIMYTSISLSMLLINLAWFYTKPVLQWMRHLELPSLSHDVPFANLTNIAIEWIHINCIKPLTKMCIKILEFSLGENKQYTIIYLIVFTLIIAFILYFVISLVFFLSFILLGGLLAYHIFIRGMFFDVVLSSTFARVVLFILLIIIASFLLSTAFDYVFIVLFGVLGPSMFLAHFDYLQQFRYGFAKFYSEIMTNSVSYLDRNVVCIFGFTAVVFCFVQFYHLRNRK